MTVSARGLGLLSMALALVACGDDDGGDDMPDAGVVDAAMDASDDDASPEDASSADASTGDAGPQPATVETTSGPVRGGVTREAALVFYGIPYAAPPVGPLRFRPPAEPEPWTEPLDATRPRASCPQIPIAILPVRGAEQEDCLDVNVFTPNVAPETPMPVMVFIHGGGFTAGSGNSLLYDGSRLARLGNVVVTLNYRLGLAGFLSHPALDAEGDGASGMYGMLDQQAALRWVRDNVASFGGDPSTVTIFGESAGGISVCLHYVMPGSRGLFSRAISESGSCLGDATGLAAPAEHAPALARGQAIAAELGCPGTGAEAIECLRGLDVEALVDAAPFVLPSVREPAYRALPIGPNVDGVTLPDLPETMVAAGDHADTPYLMGTNLDEGTFFTDDEVITSPETYATWVRSLTGDQADGLLELYPADDYETPLAAADAMFRDLGFVCPTRDLAIALTQADVDVHLYQVIQTNAATGALMLGVTHGVELLYVFGNFPLPFVRPSDAEQRVRDAVQGYWTRFAATGDPNGEGALDWPLFGSDQSHMVIGDPLSTDTALARERCEAIAALVTR